MLTITTAKQQSTLRVPQLNTTIVTLTIRIDQEIGILVSRLASTQLSAESVGNELSVLTMIVILGARIQLFNTAILHSSMAGFLKPVVAECLQQNVSTAKDISDMILQAQVLDNTRVSYTFQCGLSA